MLARSSIVTGRCIFSGMLSRGCDCSCPADCRSFLACDLQEPGLAAGRRLMGDSEMLEEESSTLLSTPLGGRALPASSSSSPIASISCLTWEEEGRLLRLSPSTLGCGIFISFPMGESVPAWLGELDSVVGSRTELVTETMLLPSPAAMAASVVSGEGGEGCGCSAISVSTSDTARTLSTVLLMGPVTAVLIDRPQAVGQGPTPAHPAPVLVAKRHKNRFGAGLQNCSLVLFHLPLRLTLVGTFWSIPHCTFGPFLAVVDLASACLMPALCHSPAQVKQADYASTSSNTSKLASQAGTCVLVLRVPQRLARQPC